MNGCIDTLTVIYFCYSPLYKCDESCLEKMAGVHDPLRVCVEANMFECTNISFLLAISFCGSDHIPCAIACLLLLECTT